MISAHGESSLPTLTSGLLRNTLAVALAANALFILIEWDRGAAPHGLTSIILGFAIFAVSLLPIVAAAEGRINKFHPYTVLGVLLSGIYGVPALYHAWLGQYIDRIDAAHYLPIKGVPNEEYMWLFTVILIWLVPVVLIAAPKLSGIPSRASSLTAGSISFPVAGVMAGSFLLLLGVTSSILAWDGISGWIARFWEMGTRSAPEAGNARFLFLSYVGMPGGYMLAVSLRELGDRGCGVPKWVINTVIFATVAVSFIPVINLGGRLAFLQVLFGWMIVFETGIRRIPLGIAAAIAFFALIVIQIMTQIRAAYGLIYQFEAQGAAALSLVSEAELTGVFAVPLALKLDGITLTYLSFNDEPLAFGSTLFAYVLKFVIKLFVVAGFPLDVERPWMMIEHHGFWVFGDYSETWLSLTTIGEFYFNFGAAGVLFLGVITGFIIRSFSHLYSRAYRRATPLEPFNVAMLGILAVLMVEGVTNGLFHISVFHAVLFQIIPVAAVWFGTRTLIRR